MKTVSNMVAAGIIGSTAGMVLGGLLAAVDQITCEEFLTLDSDGQVAEGCGSTCFRRPRHHELYNIDDRAICRAPAAS